MQYRKMIKIICTNLIDDGWPIQTLCAYKLMHNGKIIWKYVFKQFITAANYILFHNLDQLLSLKCWLFKSQLSRKSTKTLVIEVNRSIIQTLYPLPFIIFRNQSSHI